MNTVLFELDNIKETPVNLLGAGLVYETLLESQIL
jgi:hypothetical protein